MIKPKIGSIRFFSTEEYNNLKYKHLSKMDYATFIESCNRRIADELIVRNPEGWEMPFNLGKLQIHKNFNIKGSKNTVTGETYLNFHTLGYIYKCRHYKLGRKSFYSSNYSSLRKKERIKEVPTMLYKFNNHRYNINRNIARVSKKEHIDYQEYDKNSKAW